jgi:flagellar protein FlaG
MSLTIAAAGSSYPQQDFSPERIAPQIIRSAEARAAAVERVQASLPNPGEHRSPEVERMVAEMERVTLAFDKKLKFVVDHQTQEVTVKVIDPATDKVIKVLPPEELQRLHRRLRETLGVLLDERI